MKRAALSLNLDRWKTYVQSSPRNYSMIVMFTVLGSNTNCPICKYDFICKYSLFVFEINRTDLPTMSSLSWLIQVCFQLLSIIAISCFWG